MSAKISGWKFDNEEDIYMVTKHLSTNYLSTSKGKIVTLQWRNLSDIILIEWSLLR